MIIAMLLWFSTNVFAAGSPSNEVRADYLMGQRNVRNYVLNPNCRKNTSNISVSGSATVTRNTTTPLSDVADCSITLGSNSLDYTSYPSSSIERKLLGNVCEGSFIYTSSAIGNKVTPIVYVGSTSYPGNVLSSATTPVTSTTSYPCGTSSVAHYMKISNNPINVGASTLKVSDVYLGQATDKLITDNSNGIESIGRVSINTSCTSSPCVISEQSGSFVSSVTRQSGGNYTVNFNTGKFSSAPTCSCAPLASSTNGCTIQAVTTSSATLIIANMSGFSATDSAFSVLCMGRK